MRNSEYMLRAGRRERASVDGRCWHGHAKHARWIARGGRHWRNRLCTAGASFQQSWLHSQPACREQRELQAAAWGGGTAAAALPSQTPRRQQPTAQARTSAGKCRTSACCPCALPPWRPQLLATAVAGRGTRGRRQAAAVLVRRSSRCAAGRLYGAWRSAFRAALVPAANERGLQERRASAQGGSEHRSGRGAQKGCHSAPSDLDQCDQLRGRGSSGSALVGRLQQPSGPLTRFWTLGAQGIGPWVARRLLLGRQAAQMAACEFSASASPAPGPKRCCRASHRTPHRFPAIQTLRSSLQALPAALSPPSPLAPSLAA